MVENPIQDRRSNDRVAKDLIPLAKGSVESQNQGSFLIAPGDELEEQMGAMAIDGDGIPFKSYN